MRPENWKYFSFWKSISQWLYPSLTLLSSLVPTKSFGHRGLKYRIPSLLRVRHQCLLQSPKQILATSCHEKCQTLWNVFVGDAFTLFFWKLILSQNEAKSLQMPQTQKRWDSGKKTHNTHTELLAHNVSKSKGSGGALAAAAGVLHGSAAALPHYSRIWSAPRSRVLLCAAAAPALPAFPDAPLPHTEPGSQV